MGIDEFVVLGYLDINLFLKFPASFPAVPPFLTPAPLSLTSNLGLSYALDLSNELLPKFWQKKLP